MKPQRRCLGLRMPNDAQLLEMTGGRVAKSDDVEVGAGKGSTGAVMNDIEWSDGAPLKPKPPRRTPSFRRGMISWQV